MSQTHASSIVVLANVLRDFVKNSDLQAFSPNGEGRYEERTKIATRIHEELESHQGEHREALDALNEVIPARVLNHKKNERDLRAQLSAIREAMMLLALEWALV